MKLGVDEGLALELFLSSTLTPKRIIALDIGGFRNLDVGVGVAAAERIWHTKYGQGQILALDSRRSSQNLSSCSLFAWKRSVPGYR